MDDDTAALESPHTLDGPSLHRLAVQAERQQLRASRMQRTGGFDTVDQLLDFAEKEARPWRFEHTEPRHH